VSGIIQTKKRRADVLGDLSSGFARLGKLRQFSVEKSLELHTRSSHATLQRRVYGTSRKFGKKRTFWL